MPKLSGWKKKVDTRLKKVWTFHLPSGERIARLIWSKVTSSRYSPIKLVLEVGGEIKTWNVETIQESYTVMKRIKEQISEEIYG